MLHTTLVLSIVLSFCLLNRNFPPNNPSALSIFNYRLSLSFTLYLSCSISLYIYVSLSLIPPPHTHTHTTHNLTHRFCSLEQLMPCLSLTVQMAVRYIKP